MIEYCEIFYDEMLYLMWLIMCGDLLFVMVVVIIIGLCVKKEMIGEIVVVVIVMCEFVNYVEVQDNLNFVDIVGIGGDGLYMFNILIVLMFVMVVVGVKVVKYGNCGVLSKFGSVDVFEVFGVNIDLQLDQVVVLIVEIGMGFMFVLNYYLVMKNIVVVCCEFGVCMIFNIFGLLINLVGVLNQLMGVFYVDFVGIQVCVMQCFGVQYVFVVYGKDGMDEVLFGVVMFVGELCDGKVYEYEIYLEDFGLQMVLNCMLKVENVDEFCMMLFGVLDNQLGVVCEIVMLNVGIVFYVVNVVELIVDGIQFVCEVIVSGKVCVKVDEFVCFMQQFKC